MIIESIKDTLYVLIHKQCNTMCGTNACHEDLDGKQMRLSPTWSAARADCTGRLLKSMTVCIALTSKGSLKTCLVEKPAGGREPERSRAHIVVPT